MLIEFIEVSSDLETAGQVKITIENWEDLKQLHGNSLPILKEWEIEKLVEAKISGFPIVETVEKQKRGYYLIVSSLECEFSAPYIKLFSETIGFNLESGIIDLVEFMPRACHTHFLQSFGLEYGHFCYGAIVQSEPWNGLTSWQYAEKSAARTMAGLVGSQEVQREFIPNMNGTYSPNPDYGRKMLRILPAVESKIAGAIMGYWMKNHATPAQLAIYDQWHKLLTENRCFPKAADFLKDSRGGIRIAWEGPAEIVSWEDFRAMGGK